MAAPSGSLRVALPQPARAASDRARRAVRRRGMGSGREYTPAVAEFARRLTLLDLVLIGAGGAIGSGIFRTPSQVAAAVPSPGGMLLAWAIGGVVTRAGGRKIGAEGG